MNLINNAKNEINEIEKGPVPKESIEDLEKKFEDIKSGKSEKTVKINRLKMHIEKLEDERANYESQKNTSRVFGTRERISPATREGLYL